MDLRHEVKHEINYSDMLVIRHRLSTVAYPDPYAINGKYHIRSLYFDDLSDKALMDKLNGVSFREKFRIRYYNGDTSVILLEKKTKINQLGNKQSAPLFVNRKSHTNPYIVVIRCSGHDSETKANDFLKSKAERCVIKSKTAQKGAVELNIEIRLKDDNTDFVNELAEIDGVQSAALVSYNGDYMG